MIHFDKLNARLNKTAHIAAEAMMQSWQAFSQGFSSPAEQTEPAPALEDARAAVERRGEWAKAHLRLAAALAGLRKHDEASAAYEAALACEPSNKQIRGLLAASQVGEASDRSETPEKLLTAPRSP